MYRIWDQIYHDIQNKNWDSTNGLRDLVRNQLDIILVKEPIQKDPNRNYVTLPRHGDILVGFYQDPVKNERVHELNITIGGETIPDLTITPGEFIHIYI